MRNKAFDEKNDVKTWGDLLSKLQTLTPEELAQDITSIHPVDQHEDYWYSFGKLEQSDIEELKEEYDWEEYQVEEMEVGQWYLINGDS